MIKNLIPFIFVFFVNASYASSGNFDLGNAAVKLAGELMVFQALIFYFSYFAGVVLALHFLVEIKKESDAAGQQRASTFGIKPFWGLVLATCLMALPWAINVVSASFGLDGGVSCLSGSGSSSIASISAAFYIIKVVGLIVVIKAFIVFWHISKGESSQHSTRQSLGWLIFGTFAINIEQTIAILSGTLGVDFNNLLQISSTCGSGSSLGYSNK